MMDAKSMYGSNEVSMSMPTQKAKENFTYTYESMRQNEPLPMGAIIKSVDKRIVVSEISNGYLKRTCIDTYYEYPEKEEKGEMGSEAPEMERGWNYTENVEYFKEKPLDVSKLYM